MVIVVVIVGTRIATGFAVQAQGPHKIIVLVFFIRPRLVMPVSFARTPKSFFPKSLNDEQAGSHRRCSGGVGARRHMLGLFGSIEKVRFGV